MTPATLMGILGVAGGIGGILVQRWWQRQDKRLDAERSQRDRLQSHVLDSLKWFEGRTQKRSIGISVIEGNWAAFPELHLTWISVLTNQVVYLLAESEEGDSLNELANLDRMMDLLSQARARMTVAQVRAVRDALEKNERGRHGLRIADVKRREWQQAFGLG
jgi:hypothetical protein